MKNETLEALINLNEKYNLIIGVMESNAEKSMEEDGRAYGGFIRMAKGKLQEDIAESLVRIAWNVELGAKKNRLEINSNKISIEIKPEYLERIKSIKVRRHIESRISEYSYGLSVDKHVFIDGRFVLGIECKAYTENAMIKRILVDFMLLKTKFPHLKSYLFQLESMLGGDYEEAMPDPLGSIPTHSIMSYFDTVDLEILTLLKGARKVNEPINKLEYFKPLQMPALEEGIEKMVVALKEYA